MTPVKSSSIDAIGHAPATNALTVRFKSGETYRYDGVSPAQHAKFVGAASVGKHFQNHILPKFKATKVSR